MDSLIDRIRRSIAQRGCIGTFKLCVISVLWMVLPRYRRVEERRERADAEFDRKYGVDTGGVFRPKAHEVVGQNWAFGGNFQAIEPDTFMDGMKRLDLPFEQFTFIDFGSGKGRTLLLASLFPFKKVIGVEYCRELNEAARQNALAFRPPERRCFDIEVYDGDAAEFEIPNDPLVVFLFHPFAEPVMSKVIDNIADSYRRNPRRVVVVYFLPNLARLWEGTGLFQRTNELPAIFDTGHRSEARREVAVAAQSFSMFVLEAFSAMGGVIAV